MADHAEVITPREWWNAPDRAHDPAHPGGYRPSWSGADGPLNDEHERYATEPEACGAEDPAAVQKLYELAYHAGGVILDVAGTDTRRARVALGAARRSAAAQDRASPQLYVVHDDPAAIDGMLVALTGDGLAEHAIVYHGDLAGLRRDLPIVPTMVSVGCSSGHVQLLADLNLLAAYVAPGTPILCHGLQQPTVVQQLIRQQGLAECLESIGVFGRALLLRATRRCGGVPRGLGPALFARVRDALVAAYGTEDDAAVATRAPQIAAACAPAREALRMVADDHRRAPADTSPPAAVLVDHARGRSGYGPWPYANAEHRALPATMPGGRPWPKISVVTPSYNQGEFIEETILSVLNQGYPNLEYIMIDGGSTDQTGAVLERYRDHFDVLVSESDDGQSDAINKGFGRATGEILTWLNSDDMFAPGALAAVAMGFAEHESDLLAGACRIMRDGEFLAQHITACAKGPLPLDDLLDIDNCWLAGQFFYQPEVFFTRSAWERAGGYVNVSLYYSMDYELWLRLASAGCTIATIGRPLAIHRAHPEQKTYIPERYQKELREVRERFCQQRNIKPRAGRPRTRRELRITFFNDIGWGGGAGVAHRRLAEACVAAGHEVTVLAAADSNTPGHRQATTNDTILREIDASRPDLVLLGNLHSAGLTPALTGAVAQRWPTVQIMHDLFPITGRCAYTGGCQKYLAGCDDTCPTPDEYPQLEPERIADAWQLRRDAYTSANPPVLLGNSAWTADVVRAALAAYAENLPNGTPRSPVEPIRLGCPVEVLKPCDRRLSRRVLGLPQDKFIILTSGSTVVDPRKGLHLLADALEQTQLHDTLVVSAGRADKGTKLPIPGMQMLGYVRDLERLAMVYSAADVFVGPSLEEAFGQVFVEAAACGIPAIGFPVGGIPEALRDGVSGLLARETSAAALAECLATLHDQPTLRRDLGAWGRMLVENDFSYAAAYHRLFSAWRAAGLGERLSLVPKIGFRADQPKTPTVRCLEQTLLTWDAISGFDPWEGPYPKESLPRCRWTLGPVARFAVRVPHAGRYRVIVAIRNRWQGQAVRLVHGPRILSEVEIPTIDSRRACFVQGEVDLPAGTSEFELHHRIWNLADERACALIVTDVVALPMSHGRLRHQTPAATIAAPA